MFSEYASVLDVMHKRFKDVAVRIDGSVSPPKKARLVRAFQKDPKIRLVLGHIKSAGTAITLTAADREVFNDIPWNPDAILQAERRAVRLGLDHVVHIDYMAARGTSDEKRARVLEGQTRCVKFVFGPRH